ncbi:hypothetical protein GGI17_002937 [Coemansia sp. S146]|nr:hypothetical protein GGI17_002937 [Coemansia sp. S146]
MVSSRSPFQTLPMLIVHKVIEYLEGRRRTSFNADIDKHNETKSVLTPLLSVGERWRMVALDSICDNCKFDFDAKRESVEVTYPAWPADFSYPQFRKNHLVKRVVVVATLWADLYIGKFCEVIAKPQYESLMFSSATTLVLHLSNSTVNSSKSSSYGYSCNDLSAADIQGKAATIARSLLHLIPTAVGIVVSVLPDQATQYHYYRQIDFGGLYGKIVSELCQGSARSVQVFSKRNDSPISFNLSIVPGLTSITQESNISCAPFAELAYLNASTLKALGLRLANMTEWINVIYGGTTIPTSYTSLASLTLAISGISYSIIWAAIKDIAPFPVLSRLDISGGYPFDDDLLFRGNGGTMKTLRIPLSAIARNALGRFGVLKRSGVTRMTRICIDEVTEADREFLIANAGVPIERSIHSILEVARSLRAKDKVIDYRIYKAIFNAPSTAILQCLDFGYESLDVGNVINLLVALPSLVSLTCGVVEFEESTTLIPANERPNTLHAKHYPLSTNFRVWRVPKTSNSKAKDIAYAAMLLAVLCPNFTHVDISPNLRNDFGREIIWAAFSDPFEPYSDSLRRLVYKRAD